MAHNLFRNSLFDIYQITFEKDGPRLENYYNNNHKLNGHVQFFPAVDTISDPESKLKEGIETQTYDIHNPRLAGLIKQCPGKIGCNLSHYYLYNKILESSPYEWHLILEDDVEIAAGTTKLMKTLQKLLEEIKENQIETEYIKLITFEYFIKTQFIPELKVENIENLYRKMREWGTGAQLVSNKGLKIILNNRPWDFIDETINVLHKELNSVTFRNDLFINKGAESYSENFNDKTKKYGSLIYDMKSDEIKHKIGFPSKSPQSPYFMHGWFKNNNEIKKKILQLFTEYRVKVLIEFGCWYGDSTTFFATECNLDKIYCVDLWNEEMIIKNPNIGFKNQSVFERRPLYKTFIQNMWKLRDKIIPVREDTCASVGIINYLPYKPDAIFIDGEHTYNMVSKELSRSYASFGCILMFGTNYDNKEIKRAITDFMTKRKNNYDILPFGKYFFLLPKRPVIRYTGFWKEFNPDIFFIKKLLPTVKFVNSEDDETIILQGDYGSPDLNSYKGKAVIAYSAEAWFKSLNTFNTTITCFPTKGKNLQLRNYERIYFERFGKTNVYSNIPLINKDVSERNFCCFVVRNPHSWQRNLFFDMLNKIKKVDSLGSHKKNVDFDIPARNPHTTAYDDYISILGNYKFCICFENVSYPHYLTEKLYNAMKAGVVPIYWGDPNCVKIYNPESFIYVPVCENKNDQIEEFRIAIDKVLSLENNPEEYQKMLDADKVLNVGKENYRVEKVLDDIKNRIPKLKSNSMF
jgi:alpha(1,3/1,4) fucosyltransferase